MRYIEMKYQAILACPNDDILYYKEHVSKDKFLKCEESRYWVDKVTKKVPHKVLCYIPIIPRLQRLFRCNKIAQFMDYHAMNRIQGDGIMKQFMDSLMTMLYIIINMNLQQNVQNFM